MNARKPLPKTPAILPLSTMRVIFTQGRRVLKFSSIYGAENYVRTDVVESVSQNADDSCSLQIAGGKTFRVQSSAAVVARLVWGEAIA